ncbi:type II secretion system F family protein [soil metagenome]
MKTALINAIHKTNRSFLWEGRNKSGQFVTGCSSANNAATLKRELRQQGIIPIKIRNKTQSIWNRRKKLTAKDITFFTRQLATLIIAGIPLVQALDIIARGQNNITARTLYLNLKKDLEHGHTFSETLSKHPRYFGELYSNLVHAGEQSGSLDIMLTRVANYKERTESIKAKVKKALYYPSAVILLALAVTTVLLIWVVPQFQTLYQGFGADLPVLTRMIIKMSACMQKFWWLMLTVLIAVGWLVILTKQKVTKFALFLDRATLQLPIVGIILKKAIIARFARTLATTFAAGLPIVEALRSVAKATGNLLYTQATLKIRERVTTGQQLHYCLQTSNLFPDLVIEMIAIGEESGSLEHMLAKVADFYEEDVDNAVDALSSLIEPIIMVILGILIGGLVIAMYLPIFKLGSVV